MKTAHHQVGTETMQRMAIGNMIPVQLAAFVLGPMVHAWNNSPVSGVSSPPPAKRARTMDFYM